MRQPLTCFKTNYPNPGSDLEELVKDEVNVKNVLWGKLKGKDLKVELDIKITPSLLEEAKTRELIRIIQEKRKEMRIGLTQNILVKNPWIPSSQDLIQKLKKVTYTSRIYKGDFDVRKTYGKNI